LALPSPHPARPLPAPQTLSNAQAVIVATPFGTMLSLLAASLAVYTAYVTFNAAVVALLRLPMPEAACIVIMASYKVGWGGVKAGMG
jgi:hypothetical protein